MVASSDSATPPLLEMKGIVKTFPGVKALSEVTLTLARGEVLALVGENGAGKSTLIKALGGAHLPDSGEILIDGKPVTLRSPQVSQREGIAIIFQEFNLAPKLSARENLFLGKEIVNRGFIDHRAERAQARELFGQLGMSIDPEARCENLTVAEQQTVEIARALASDARIIVMDEPTAALSQQEVDKLLSIIRRLRKEGISIIYISHRLEEIYEIADRVTVLRDGETVGEAPVSEVSKSQLIEWMVGRPLEEEFPERQSNLGPVRLKVENLSRGSAVRGVNFELREGEVLGISGLVGSGRTEMVRLIFGADHLDQGNIIMDGKERRICEPRDAIRNGICLLTEDRKEQGLILIHSAQ
jgi:ribose transport system ATP-binding protein